MESETINEITKLIRSFKSFLFNTIKNNNNIKDDNKNSIFSLLDVFINEGDPYAFKSVVKILLQNKEQFLNKVSLTEEDFNSNNQKKYYEYMEVFKAVYNL